MAQSVEKQLKQLCELIKSDTSELKQLPRALAIFEKHSSTLNNGIQQIEDIFLHFNETIPFLTSKKSKDKSRQKALQWMRDRYSRHITLLCYLLHDTNTNIHKKAFKSLVNFAHIQNDSDLFQQITMFIVTKPDLSNDIKSWFVKFYCRNNETNEALRSLINICRMPRLRMCRAIQQKFSVGFNQTFPQSSLQLAFDYSNDSNFTRLQNEVLRNCVDLLLRSKALIDSNKLANRSYDSEPPKKRQRIDTNPTEMRKNLISQAWLGYLGQTNLSVPIYHKILTNLMNDIFPVFTNPLLLADFLTASYDIGGEISLLSLQGLFVLIHKHNLDYPQFYEKLYARLKPNIFFSRNDQKFFEMLSLFLLQSTHIPEYMIAAFAKKLSRMSLFAPPNGIVFITSLITKLLRKYPAIRFLVDQSKKGTKGVIEAIQTNSQQKMKRTTVVNNTNGDDSDSDIEESKADPTDNDETKESIDNWESEISEALESDPFLYECDDPKRCNASESSLWELKAQIYHYEYRTSGLCHETVLHFKSRHYKPLELRQCPSFAYQKLLNYYVRTQEKTSKDFKKKQRRGNKWGTKNVDAIAETSEENQLHPISTDRSDHLFASESVFRSMWSV